MKAAQGGGMKLVISPQSLGTLILDREVYTVEETHDPLSYATQATAIRCVKHHQKKMFESCILLLLTRQ